MSRSYKIIKRSVTKITDLFKDTLVPRKGLEPSYLAAYASETYVSTIPPSGHKFLLVPDVSYVHPSYVSHRFTDARIREYGSHCFAKGHTPRVLPCFARGTHLPFHHLGMVSSIWIYDLLQMNIYSTVTLFARFLGLSISRPRVFAI